MMKRMVALFGLCYWALNASAQFDTNYVKKYNNKLVVSLFQSSRSYGLKLNQKLFLVDSLSSVNYIAQANHVTGFSVDYDKISFSVGWKTPVSEQDIYKKGRTTYSAYNFSFTGSKYRLETSYKRYQGFYDANTSAYDTSYTNSLPYYQNPSLVTRSFKAKGFYFMNKKQRFSYSSSYSNTSRQLKTAGSFLIIGNVYNLFMYSDSAIIPNPISSYYGPWATVNYFNLYGFSLGPGYTFNKVFWKKIFFNITLTLGVEARHRYYKNDALTFASSGWNVSVAAVDARTSIGFNNKNFFVSITNMNDYNIYNLKTIKLEVSYISGSFNIGYRFPLKEYRPIKAMKDNTYYKMF